MLTYNAKERQQRGDGLQAVHCCHARSALLVVIALYHAPELDEQRRQLLAHGHHDVQHQRAKPLDQVANRGDNLCMTTPCVCGAVSMAAETVAGREMGERGRKGVCVCVCGIVL